MNFTSRVYRVAIRYSILKERNFRDEIKQDDPEGFRRDLTDEALQRQINLTRKLQSRKLREHK